MGPAPTYMCLALGTSAGKRMLIMGDLFYLTSPPPEMVTMGGRESPRAWTISRQQAPSTRHSKTIPNPRAQNIYGGPWQESCKT